MQDLDSAGIRNFAVLFAACYTFGLGGYLIGRVINRRPIEGAQIRRLLVFLGVYVVIYVSWPGAAHCVDGCAEFDLRASHARVVWGI